MNAPRDEVPSKVGRYQIVESIGFGAMGAVYKAFDPLIKRTIAIKTIRLDVPPQSPHYRTFIERFYHEARISGTLSHPNIVTLFDIGETEDKVPFLAMEFIDGETVADVLNEGRLFRPEQVIGLVSQMAAAIDYAHAKGVIHRDIKPSNIILHEGEKVKVTDFGIAKLVDSDITHSGSLLGTPSYMSPEQAMGESLDGRSDIFSLGVVAFEMLSGQQPFPGNNVTSILYKLVHADPVRPPNLEVLGLLPDKWHEVFSKVLSKNPPDRYGTGADFVSELELCLGSWFGSLEGETVYMTAPAESASSDKPSSSPPRSSPGHKKQEGKTAPANLLGVDDGDENDDEAVVFEGGGETVKDNPAFWGSPETNIVDQGPAHTAHTAHTRSVGPFPGGLGNEETARESVSTRAHLAERDSAANDETRTFSKNLSPTRTEAPAANLATRVAQSVGEHVPSSLAEFHQLWQQRRGLVAAVGGALVVVVVGLVVVMTLSTSGGKTQSPSASASEAGLAIQSLPVEATPVATDVREQPGGILSIESEPIGASVLINGAKLGLTPLEILELELGSYTVRLEKVGYEPEELSAELNADNPRATLSVPLKGEATPEPQLGVLRVDSTPPGAQVLLDGKPAGTTPLQKLRARPGSHTIRLQKMGFEPWETRIDLKAGATESISATLEPREKKEPVPAPVTPKVSEGDLVERGPGVVDPKCIKCPGVGYPEVARRAKLEGSVQVSFIVTELGTVEAIEIEQSGGDVFDRAVINTVEGWQHEPATKNGVRVKLRMRKRFTFRRGN